MLAAVTFAGLVPCHQSLMEGHIGDAIGILGASCLAAIMLAAALRVIRFLQETKGS